MLVRYSDFFFDRTFGTPCIQRQLLLHDLLMKVSRKWSH